MTRTLRFRVYPVTSLLLLQYGLLVLLPALLGGSDELPFLVTVMSVAVLVAVCVEAPVAHIPSLGGRRRRVHPLAALGITLIGLIATLSAALGGQGSYATQIGAQDRAWFTTLLTPLRPWALAGPALCLYAWRLGERISRPVVLGVLGLCIFASVAVAFAQAILAPSARYGLALVSLALVARLVDWRFLLALLVVALLAWPAAHAIRNDLRLRLGANAAEIAHVEPLDRLRLDQLLDRVAHLDYPVDIGQPSATETLRYGLLPRALDPSRPELSTGYLISQRLTGGRAFSADTFTLLGNLLALTGWLGLALYVLATTVLTAVLTRRSGPWALPLLAVIIDQLLWIEATFPDSIAATLQAGLSVCIAVALAANPTLAEALDRRISPDWLLLHPRLPRFAHRRGRLRALRMARPRLGG